MRHGERIRHAIFALSVETGALLAARVITAVDVESETAPIELLEQNTTYRED